MHDPFHSPTDPVQAVQDAPAKLDAESFFQAVFDLVRQGDAEQLGSLLEKGLPANLRNHKGDSLLMLASYHGHLEAARQLLAYGADPDVQNDQGQSPIVGAVFKGNESMVRLLLDGGADIEGAGPAGKSALMMAAMFNRTQMVELLLERGADLYATDVNGLSVADAAQLMGAEDTAAQLRHLYQLRAKSEPD